MLDRIDHRGPDGRGLWLEDCIGLGHQQLQSTPEGEYDDQPYREGDLVVTADVRLDNRAELFDLLSIAEPPDRVPDSRLLLAAFREWGEQCVDHLIGAYAFVVWDGSTTSVFCARDHFGVKPLYYCLSESVFAVASEMKALLALPTVSKLPDDVKIGDFLVGNFQDKSRTYYADIRRLPPAHATVVKPDWTESWQYWDLDPTRTVTLDSDAAYERRFRDLFEQAVQCRLRTNGTVGTALSGGLDSSSITVVAGDLLPPETQLHAFSNVYDDAPASDEREFIEAVADRPGITSHYVPMDDVGSFEYQDRMMEYYDLPPHDSMHHAVWERIRRADREGVDVLLEGVLGDSATGYGLGLLAEQLRTGRWRQLVRELRAMSTVGGARVHRLFLQNAVDPLVPRPLKRTYKRLRGQPVLTERKNPTLDQRFVDRVALGDRLRERETNWALLRETGRRRQYRSLTFGTITASLETADLVNAAYGIEPRYPFTDKRLVEFSLAMPTSQQLSDGWTRSIIRRALADRLPEAIRTRPWKTDMSQGFWNSLSKETDRLERLIDEPGRLDGYLDLTALEAAYDRFSDEPNTRDARALWRALSLAVWFDTHGIDTDPTTDSTRATRKQ